jgi:hypothetical protein
MRTFETEVDDRLAPRGGRKYRVNVDECDSVWWIAGQIGWQLINVVRIEPVWCSGQQGLWNLPDPILAQVRTNYQVACQLTKNPGSSSDSLNPNSIASNSSNLPSLKLPI